jgi:uncharacterized coiled-coil DUF342 family protein
VDITPYFGGIVSALIATITAWVALKTSYEKRFTNIETKLAAQDERVHHALTEAEISRELTVQIASLSAKMDDLAKSVDKHNDIVERTYQVESNLKTAFHRIDELREEIHDMKIGGTS